MAFGWLVNVTEDLLIGLGINSTLRHIYWSISKGGIEDVSGKYATIASAYHLYPQVDTQALDTQGPTRQTTFTYDSTDTPLVLSIGAISPTIRIQGRGTEYAFDITVAIRLVDDPDGNVTIEGDDGTTVRLGIDIQVMSTYSTGGLDVETEVYEHNSLLIRTSIPDIWVLTITTS